ncbi:MAG: Dph6-related ATP pyrophosphatase [Methermicoccaceae archaeon]
MKVFVSWSSGKDSTLALYRALNMGFEVEYLLTMLDENGLWSRGHGLKKEVLDAQAKALGIPILYGKASWEGYEEEFKKLIRELQEIGIEGGVFGDISLQEHKDWVDRVCEDAQIKAFEPLWQEDYDNLLGEFMDSGFEAIIVSTRADLVDGEWMGHRLDRPFIEYIRNQNLDICGEDGEYHTLVTDGPIFNYPVNVVQGDVNLLEDVKINVLDVSVPLSSR